MTPATAQAWAALVLHLDGSRVIDRHDLALALDTLTTAAANAGVAVEIRKERVMETLALVISTPRLALPTPTIAPSWGFPGTRAS